MAPQADLREQSLAVGHRHPASNTTRASRSWSPSVPAGTFHRDQDIVERFNRTLAERLFGHQYAQEMCLPSDERSTEWVKRLPSVVAALIRDVTRLTGKKPSDAIKAKALTQKPSSVVTGRPPGLNEQGSERRPPEETFCSGSARV